LWLASADGAAVSSLVRAISDCHSTRALYAYNVATKKKTRMHPSRVGTVNGQGAEEGVCPPVTPQECEGVCVADGDEGLLHRDARRRVRVALRDTHLLVPVGEADWQAILSLTAIDSARMKRR